MNNTTVALSSMLLMLDFYLVITGALPLPSVVWGAKGGIKPKP